MADKNDALAGLAAAAFLGAAIGVQPHLLSNLLTAGLIFGASYIVFALMRRFLKGSTNLVVSVFKKPGTALLSVAVFVGYLGIMFAPWWIPAVWYRLQN